MLWKQIPNSVYKVSDTGIVVGNHPNYPEHELKHEIHVYDGHHRVCLIIDGHKVRPQVHRLVAELFIPNPNNLPCVNHIDENPDNNCVDNLEWCTVQYNTVYNDAHKKRGLQERDKVEVYLNGEYIETVDSVSECIKKYEYCIYKHPLNAKPSKKGYNYNIIKHLNVNRNRPKSVETIREE